MKYIKSFEAVRKNKTKNRIMIEEIKRFLLEENDYDSWEEYIDIQECGECQQICSSIKRNFPKVKHIFGHIKTDEPVYDDGFGTESFQMTHHWIEYDNELYEFSKGTLKDYIEDIDMYDVEIYDNWRYMKLYEKN